MSGLKIDILDGTVFYLLRFDMEIKKYRNIESLKIWGRT